MLGAGVATELAKSSANRWLGIALVHLPCFLQLHLDGCMQAICKIVANDRQCFQGS